MSKEKIKEVFIPKALEELNKGEILEEIEGKRCQMKRNNFEFEGEEYVVLEQNTYKNSKYASLAKKGNHVVWIIPPIGSWFLVINNQWVIKKDLVTPDSVPPEAIF